VTGRAVSRSTCTASGPVSFPWMRCFFAASRPHDINSPTTPAVVGVDSEVVPPVVATENIACGPHDV
jgi:hypothetical protein